MIKNIIKLLFGKFDKKTLHVLYYELSANSLIELHSQTDFVQLNIMQLSISKSILLIFELGKDFTNSYETSELRLKCADSFIKYRDFGAYHFKDISINMHHGFKNIEIFGDRYLTKTGQLYTVHRRYYQLDSDFIILYDELFNAKLGERQSNIQEEGRQRRIAEEIERQRKAFLKQQQEEAIKNHNDALRQQQDARRRAADKLNESYRRKQQNERTSQKESFNRYRDMFNDPSGYFNWSDFGGNTFDGGYTKARKPNNTQHPKWELYKNLCSTIKARKSQLDEIGNSHENWEVLKNEHNQAVRTAKKLKDKYKF